MAKTKYHFERRGHRVGKKSKALGPAIPVNIDFDDPRNPVVPDPVHVNPRNHEHIVWKHKKGKDFVVSFKNDSPFNEFFFYKGHEDSGEAIYGNKASYGYSVEVDNLILDPKVIIDPHG